MLQTLWDLAAMVNVASSGSSPFSTKMLLQNDPALIDAITTAAQIVLHPDDGQFHHQATKSLGPKSPPLPAGWSKVSPPLVRRALRARNTSLRPMDRLRWATISMNPGRPEMGELHSRLRAERLPSVLWDAWALRLMPPDLTSAAQFPAAAIAGLLAVGSLVSMATLMSYVSDRDDDGRNAARCLVEVAHTSTGQDTFALLTALSIGLTRAPAPINYRRRRELARHAQLTDAESAILTKKYGGGRRMKTFANLYTWEMLTGGAAYQAPVHLKGDQQPHLSAYSRMLRDVDIGLTEYLEYRARRWLSSRGVTDEPLCWIPPVDILLMRRPVWPGVDLDDLDVATWVDRLASDDSLTNLADANAITYQQAMLIVHSRRFARRKDPESSELTHSGRRIRRLLARGVSLTEAAAAIGTSRGKVASYCKAHGIATPSPGRPPNRYDADWLREQYVDRRRPLPDIADELGCSPTSLSRSMTRAGISLRPRGGASHRSATIEHTELPLLLARVHRGQGSLVRLERYQVLVVSRSLNDAARRIGASPVTLRSQLNQLESSAGCDLIHHPLDKISPMTITATGWELSQEIESVLGLKRPKEPPEPLATAIRCFRGSDRISRLARAASYPSISTAAKKMGTDPSTLIRSVRSFEQAAGIRLAIIQGRNQPVILTDQGQLLTEQWIRWDSS